MEGFWRFNSATEHFLNWMCAADMASVQELLGPHAYALARYGVSPQDDVEIAVEKLAVRAPHLARLLREVATL
jgi:hypothetical protein